MEIHHRYAKIATTSARLAAMRADLESLTAEEQAELSWWLGERLPGSAALPPRRDRGLDVIHVRR